MRGDRLKVVREQRGLSQRELASRCGIGEKQIWRYENGESEPTSGQLIKMVKELSVSADYLLGLADEAGKYYVGEDINEFQETILYLLRDESVRDYLKVVEMLVAKVLENKLFMEYHEIARLLKKSDDGVGITIEKSRQLSSKIERLETILKDAVLKKDDK